MNIPFHESFLVDTALVILLVIAGFFIYFVFHRLTDWIRREKKYKEEGCFGCLLKFLLLTILIVGGIHFLAFAAYIQTFHSFVEDQLIGVIRCEESQYQSGKLNIELTLNHNQETIRTELLGERWQIKGEILTFKHFFTFLGIKPMYRINYITGKFASKSTNSKIENNVYNLIHYKNYKNWTWFYELGANFPAIRRIKEVSISEAPLAGSKRNIFITSQSFFTYPQPTGNIND